jgi:hypothetical protein
MGIGVSICTGGDEQPVRSNRREEAGSIEMWSVCEIKCAVKVKVNGI